MMIPDAVPSRRMSSPAGVAAGAAPTTTTAGRVLRASVAFWYLVAVAGQLMFALYITTLYGGGAVRGDIGVLNRVMPTGHVPGDTLGNATIISHLALALVIILGGALQLVPQVRRRAPAVHRLTGRTYISAALLISVGGLYLVWARGTVGDVWQHLASTLNAVLIITFGMLAWRAARAKDFSTHRRWGMRLFLVASGVWFFRVGLMLWLLIHRKPVGFDPESFTGPFLTFLAFAESLVPLLVLEAYFAAQRQSGTRGKLAMSAVLVVLTCAMAAGIAGASMGMWLPRMR